MSDMELNITEDLATEEYAAAIGQDPAYEYKAPPGMFRQMMSVFIQNKMAVVSLVALITITLFCFFGPVFYHTNQTNSSALLGQTCDKPPGPGHPLGTDSTCFDMLGRIMVGGQSSLTIGFMAAALSMLIGSIYGIFSGYRGGWADSVMMRIVDILLSIPGLFLLIDLIVIFGRSRTLIFIVLGITGWYGVARLLRSEALTLREREYAQAVKAMGGRPRRVVTRHILPNSISTVVTLTTFAVGDTILALAALGFLGYGIEFPDTDWGTILNTSDAAIALGRWWEVWPVMILFLTVVISFNYIGDALRDSFEVRLRDR
jgi:peptide/nickel transport system permease protein